MEKGDQIAGHPFFIPGNGIFSIGICVIFSGDTYPLRP